MKRSLRSLLLSLRVLLLSAGPLALAVAAAVVLAFWWLNPNPPKRVVLATGPEQSAYAEFGQRYAQALARVGIELVLLPSEGARHNLELLRSGESDLGFVQGGSAPLALGDQQALVSLGSLFVEPVWVFYREQAVKPRSGDARYPHVARISELSGWRVGVGTPGSGVPELFSSILDANRLSDKRFKLSNADQTSATVAFFAGQLDALVFASAPESPMVQMLLQTPGVALLPFAQHEAYARRLGFLKPVVLPQGVVDLAANVPARNVPLIATTTSLVARADTHPAVVQLMAQTAVGLHGEAGWFSQAREFPNLAHAQLPLAADAVRVLSGGSPWLQRYVPFWLANVVERMWLALGLIVALALPLSRIVPPIYTMRIRSRVYRWYAELRDIEDRAGLAAPDGAEPAAHLLRGLVDELNALEIKAAAMVVPLAYTDELYALRSHIQLVRKKLLLRQPTPGHPAPMPEPFVKT
jgi:TRAP-type uncharacterized transport system substrate-binding protein